MKPSHSPRNLRGTARRATVAAGLAVLAAALAPAPVASQQTPPQPVVDALSLAQAVRLAKENNPLFLQQRNDIGVARSQVRTAIGGLLPSANASTSYSYTAPGELRFGTQVLSTEPESYASSYSLGLQYQLDGNALLQPSVQRSQLNATVRRVSGAEALLEAQVKQQYLTVLQAREEVAQALREVERTEEHLRLAQARLDVGAGTPLDVRRAEVQKGQAMVALVQARNLAATAALTLGQLMGISLEPGVDMPTTFSIFDPEWQGEELVEMALLNNPALLAARATLSAAGTSVRAAKTAYLPSLGFSLGWSGYVSQYGSIDPLVQQRLDGIDVGACQRNNRLLGLINEAPRECANPTDPAFIAAVRNDLEAQNRGFPFDYNNQPWSASVRISLPIFNGFSRELQVDQAQAAAADARYEVRAEELRLRQEVATALRNLETAYETAVLQKLVVTAARDEQRLAQERFRFGAANSVEVTDAQTSLSQAERGEIDALYNFHKSLAALEALVGRELRIQ